MEEMTKFLSFMIQAVDFEGEKEGGLLKDVGTGEKVLFAGALPVDRIHTDIS